MLRVLVCTVISVFVVCSSFAETSARLDSLRISVNWQSGLAATGNDRYSSTLVNWAVNRAIQRVSNDFPAVEKMDTIVTIADTRHYALNSDFVAFHSEFKWLADSFVIVPLEYDPVQNWYKSRDGVEYVFSDAFPRYALAFNKKVTFFPVPAGGDSILLNYYATDRLLTSDTMVTAVLPAYRDGIIYYAGYIMALATQQSFYITTFAQAYNAMNPKVRIEIEAAK